MPVTDRPDPHVAQPAVTSVGHKSIVLSWYGSSYDGGSPITGYLIELCECDVTGGGAEGCEGAWRVVTDSCQVEMTTFLYSLFLLSKASTKEWIAYLYEFIIKLINCAFMTWLMEQYSLYYFQGVTYASIFDPTNASFIRLLTYLPLSCSLCSTL